MKKTAMGGRNKRGKFHSYGMMGISMSNATCPSATFGMMTRLKKRPKGKPATDAMRTAREQEKALRALARLEQAQEKRARRAAKRRTQ